MERKCFRIFISLYFSLSQFPTCRSIMQLPSIVWDPWNPLFQCDEPFIKVQLPSILSFLCPVYDLRPYLDVYLLGNGDYYETLYFVDDNFKAYNTCNATNYAHKRFLRCDGQSAKDYRFTFRENTANSKIPDMGQGGRFYYFIGTGFRTKSNLKQLVGGSCNKTDKQGQGKLRLKVYVCTPEEVRKGECEMCPSAGCYYKNCNTTCSDWEDIGEDVVNDTYCLRNQTRTCHCTLLNERGRREFRVNTTCTAPRSARRSGGDNKLDVKHLYIGVLIAIVSFIIGITVGIIFSKKCHTKESKSEESLIRGEKV